MKQKNNLFRKYLPILIVLLSTPVTGQDLGSIAKSKPFDYSGAINFSMSYYQSENDIYRSVPWQYALTANVSPAIYGIQFPISIYINNYQSGFSHPFNFYGISPSYKWAKLNLGHSSMTFSPYTLSGQTFWGAGVELTPGKFRFSALYGTFRNYAYVQNDDPRKTNLIPSFERKGYGFKIGVGSSTTFLDLIYFKAQDDDELDDVETDSLSIFPKENALIGLNGSLMFFKKVRLYVNSAVSLFTPNTNDREILDELEGYDFIGKIIEPKISTRIGFAGDAGIDFRHQSFVLGVMYKRIDPSYESLGTNYFMNDVEALSLHNSFSIFHHKMSLHYSIGLGRNNLLSNKISTNTRIIGSFNSNIRFSKMYQLQLSYTNFQMEQSIEIVDINDTIQYSQINQMLRVSPNIRWGSDDTKHSISPVFLQSAFTTLNGNNDQSTDVTSTIVSTNYRLSKKQSKLSFYGNVAWKKYIISEERETTRLGFNGGVNKRFLDGKLATNLSFGYDTGIGDNDYDSNTWTVRSTISYKLTKKQNISLSANYMNRQSETVNDLSETRLFLYYSFSLK